MAIINSGLGWQADENYMKQYAGKVASINGLTGGIPVPVVLTPSDAITQGLHLARIYTTSGGGATYDYYLICDTPGLTVVFWSDVTSNIRYLYVDVCSTDPTASAQIVRIKQESGAISVWQDRKIDRAYGQFFIPHSNVMSVQGGISSPNTMTIDSSLTVESSEADALAGVSVVSGDLTKKNDGYAVVAWVKYKWSGGEGDVEQTPILISNIAAYTEFDGLPAGAVSHSTTVYYQGIIFQMAEIYNLTATTPFAILTLDYSGSLYGELTEPELFARIANSVSLSVPIAPDPYGGNAGPGGGIGDGIGEGTPVGHPSAPTVSAAETGLVTLYVPTLSELQALASFLWSGLFDINTFRKIFADPMDAILGLSILPIPVATGASGPIRIGNQDATVSAARALGQYATVSCGSLTIPDNIGCYLDRDPYTSLSLYLPYISFVPLRADDCMGKTLSLQYIIDIFSGACVATLTADGSVVGSWAGNCATQIPITSANYNNVIAGALSVAATAATLAGGATAVAPLAVASMANTAINSQKPVISRSGSLSGAAGLMGVQTPYIIATQPRPAIPSGQNQEIGYPSYINELLGDLRGYTIVDEIHLAGISGTQAELQEIQELLAGGVIL